MHWSNFGLCGLGKLELTFLYSSCLQHVHVVGLWKQSCGLMLLGLLHCRCVDFFSFYYISQNTLDLYACPVCVVFLVFVICTCTLVLFVLLFLVFVICTHTLVLFVLLLPVFVICTFTLVLFVLLFVLGYDEVLHKTHVGNII